jgi:hypothetical protein
MHQSVPEERINKSKRERCARGSSINIVALRLQPPANYTMADRDPSYLPSSQERIRNIDILRPDIFSYILSQSVQRARSIIAAVQVVM